MRTVCVIQELWTIRAFSTEKIIVRGNVEKKKLLKLNIKSH